MLSQLKENGDRRKQELLPTFVGETHTRTGTCVTGHTWLACGISPAWQHLVQEDRTRPAQGPLTWTWGGGGMDRTLFQVAGTESEAIPPITST